MAGHSHHRRVLYLNQKVEDAFEKVHYVGTDIDHAGTNETSS